MHEAEDTQALLTAEQTLSLPKERTAIIVSSRNEQRKKLNKLERKCVSYLLISSLFTESTPYSSAKDLQPSTLRKDEFLPRHPNKY